MRVLLLSFVFGILHTITLSQLLEIEPASRNSNLVYENEGPKRTGVLNKLKSVLKNAIPFQTSKSDKFKAVVQKYVEPYKKAIFPRVKTLVNDDLLKVLAEVTKVEFYNLKFTSLQQSKIPEDIKKAIAIAAIDPGFQQLIDRQRSLPQAYETLRHVAINARFTLTAKALTEDVIEVISTCREKAIRNAVDEDIDSRSQDNQNSIIDRSCQNALRNAVNEVFDSRFQHIENSKVRQDLTALIDVIYSRFQRPQSPNIDLIAAEVKDLMNSHYEDLKDDHIDLATENAIANALNDAQNIDYNDYLDIQWSPTKVLDAPTAFKLYSDLKKRFDEDIKIYSAKAVTTILQFTSGDSLHFTTKEDMVNQLIINAADTFLDPEYFMHRNYRILSNEVFSKCEKEHSNYPYNPTSAVEIEDLLRERSRLTLPPLFETANDMLKESLKKMAEESRLL